VVLAEFDVDGLPDDEVIGIESDTGWSFAQVPFDLLDSELSDGAKVTWSVLCFYDRPCRVPKPAWVSRERVAKRRRAGRRHFATREPDESSR